LQSFKTIDSISKWLQNHKSEGKTIGFVPTMGALHAGHISLVERAKAACDFVVVSIFVNPTQFNSSDDLDKYPRTLENDIRMLFNTNCDAVFVPEVSTMYPDYPNHTDSISIDLTEINAVMEGMFRPGHFEGVVNVVHRFFEIVGPDKAYFGEKDFQQLAVIRKMVVDLGLPVEIVACPTLREKDGLAMSSRNQRLTNQGKQDALLIYNTLLEAKKLATKMTPSQVKSFCASAFDKTVLSLEYLEICDPFTLKALEDEWVPGARCFIAAFCEDVRLIDNMELVKLN
jgi:pantoate--beta-alanine ligase